MRKSGHVEPRRFREQRGFDRERPQHVAAGCQLPIPAIDRGLGFASRGAEALLAMEALVPTAMLDGWASAPATVPHTGVVESTTPAPQ
jgi:hypothetical protein